MAWDKPYYWQAGKLRLTRSGVAWIIGVAAWVAYDVVALYSGWGTLSAFGDEAAHRYPIIALAVGVVLGHLFWNNWKE